MTFSFNATAGASQSTIKPKLEGNNIYTLTLDNCELNDFNGKKEPDKVFKTIKITFSNEDGAFESTIFEPRPEDFERKETKYTDKDGKENKIPQPSGVESTMLLFKHIIDAFNPKIAEAIDSGAKQLMAPDWDALRTLVIKILLQGKGKSAKIKLLKNKNGDAQFPGFFAGVNREGAAYIKNNFIGDKIAFTAYEIKRIEEEANATPTDMTDTKMGSEEDIDTTDLNFDLDL